MPSGRPHFFPIYFDRHGAQIPVIPRATFAGDNFSINLLTAIAAVLVSFAGDNQVMPAQSKCWLLRATPAMRWSDTLGGAVHSQIQTADGDKMFSWSNRQYLQYIHYTVWYKTKFGSQNLATKFGNHLCMATKIGSQC